MIRVDDISMDARKPNPDLVRMNQQHAEFWEQQRLDSDRRIKDPAIFATAMADLNSEIARGVEIRAQKIIEAALADAEATKQRFISERARSAGKAKKTDPLQKLIEEIVCQHPSITEAELFKQLKAHDNIDPIQEITTTTIFISRANETTKKVPISGLKDRLSRTKKKLKKS